MTAAQTLDLAGHRVPRLGLGTMPLAGPGNWGLLDDPERGVRVLREAVHTHGLRHLDTADAYGPHTVEDLIRRALHPYPDDLLVATKVGLVRPGPGRYAPSGRPERLRAAVHGCLRRLGTDRLPLCYLHRVDPDVPLADQLGALTELRDQGLVGAIGLSGVDTRQLTRALAVTPIAAVQNRLRSLDPGDPVLELCRTRGIAFVPYRPLGGGELAAHASRILPALLALGDHVAPIVGTTRPDHLAQLVHCAQRPRTDEDHQPTPTKAQTWTS